MRIEDVDVFVPKPQDEEIPEPQDLSPVGDVFFTLKGQHDFVYQDTPALNGKVEDLELSKEACARKKGSRYYLRVNRRGELYNPLDSTHTSSAHHMSEGIPTWRYMDVSYAAFKNYSLFLQTRNSSYLTWARREMGA